MKHFIQSIQFADMQQSFINFGGTVTCVHLTGMHMEWMRSRIGCACAVPCDGMCGVGLNVSAWYLKEVHCVGHLIGALITPFHRISPLGPAGACSG